MGCSCVRRCLPLIALVIALMASGCKAPTKAQKRASQPRAATPPAVAGAKVALPPKQFAKTAAKAGKESEAVQAARKLGTATQNPVVTTKSGLQYIDVKAGEGAPVKVGDTVEVHYTGWLVNGTQFDTSLKGGRPFGFPIGANQVIPGWDQGVVGMKPGGIRKLIVPPDLGYGSEGRDPIPPEATLIFEIELLNVL